MSGCACGRPLHYTDPLVEAEVSLLIAEHGAMVPVTTPDGTWLVQRHFIALHGLKAEQLPSLGFKRIGTA